MAKVTLYYSVMFCPFLRQTRPEAKPTQAIRVSDHSMNHYLKRTKAQKNRIFTKEEDFGEKVPGTKMGDEYADKLLKKGIYGPTTNQRPVYEYPNVLLECIEMVH